LLIAHLLLRPACEHKSAWRKIELINVARQFGFPKIQQRITRDDYEGADPAIAITDFGYDKPTLLLTKSAARLRPQLDRVLRPPHAPRN